MSACKTEERERETDRQTDRDREIFTECMHTCSLSKLKGKSTEETLMKNEYSNFCNSQFCIINVLVSSFFQWKISFIIDIAIFFSMGKLVRKCKELSLCCSHTS